MSTQTCNQASAILAHLMEGKTLTPLEALDLFGCFRLGARIHELRGDGHDITKEMIRLPSGKRVAEYFLWRLPESRDPCGA